MADTIFDRYGGFAKVSRIVSSFYGKVLASDRLSPFFDDVEMPRLIDHQTKFMATLLGGPASFTNEHIQRVHLRLGIDDPAMDEMKIVLRESLVEHGFDESDVAAVVAAFDAYRPLVVHNPA